MGERKWERRRAVPVFQGRRRGRLGKMTLTRGVGLSAGKKRKKKEKEKEKERGVRGLVVRLIRWAVLPSWPSSF
jgi:hypothetical protein